MSSKPIPEDIGEWFRYDPDTGELWRIRDDRYKSGYTPTVVTTKTSKGYLRAMFKGTNYIQHRIAWFLMLGEQPPDVIDHVDLNHANNKWDNLRASDNCTNAQNRKVHSNSKSGIKGVFYNEKERLWYGVVSCSGKRYRKRSKDVSVVTAWVQETRTKLHGEFANQ